MKGNNNDRGKGKKNTFGNDALQLGYSFVGIATWGHQGLADDDSDDLLTYTGV